MDLKNRSKKELVDEIERLRSELDYFKKSGKSSLDTCNNKTERCCESDGCRILQRAVDQSQLSIVITDINGDVEYANPKAAESTCYSIDELTGKNIRMLKSGLAPENEFEDMWETISSGNVWIGVFENKKKNGEIFTEKATVAPVFGENGTVSNYIAIKEDITLQKNAERDASLFRSIVENANYGTVITDMEGRIVYANEAMAAMHGFEKDELTNKKLSVFHNHEQIDDVLVLLHEMVEKGSFLSREVWHSHKSGSVFPTLMSANTLYSDDGFPLYLSASAIDITEIKAAEDALKKIETNLNYAQQVAMMGSWETEFDTDRFYWSDNCYRILGMEPQQPGVKGNDFIDLIHPDDRGIYDEMFAFCTRMRMPINREFRILLPDGTLKWVSSYVVPTIEHKRLVGLNGVVLDITEKKIVEEAIKASEAELKYAQKIARMGSWEFDLVTGKYTWSENNYHLTGVPKDFEISVDFFRSMVHPEDLSLLDSQVEYLLTHQSPVTMDIRLILPKGNVVWIQNDIMPVIKDEQMVAMKGVCIDITERKSTETEIVELNVGLEQKVSERTAQLENINRSLKEEIAERKRVEDALAKSEYQYRSVVENINEIIFRTDTLGKLIFLNKAWETVTSFVSSESIGRQIFNYAIDEDRPLLTDLFKSLLKREKQFFRKELRFRTRGGGFCWLEVYAKPALDAENMINGIYGTLQDITERKMGENFEKEMLLLSAQLTAVGSAKIESSINIALERIGSLLHADRSYVFEFDHNQKVMSNTYEWCSDGICPEIENLKNIPIDTLPVWLDLFYRNEEVIIESVGNLPEDRTVERKILENQGIQSLITLPLLNEKKLIGFVGIDSVKGERKYTSAEINILRIWSSMLASLINNRNSEILLEQTRQNFEIFFNTIDELLWVMDASGNIIHFNNTVSARLGYDCDDLINKSISIVHPESTRKDAESIICEMISGNEVTCSLPLITKSGNLIPVETRIKHGFWNDKPAIFGVSKDFTQIQLSEQKFSSAFRANSALMAITKVGDNTFLDVNSAFLNTLGFSREEVIGKSNDDLKIYDEDDLDRRIKECVANDRPVRDIELTITSKNGAALTILLTSEVISIGSENCILTVAVNITDRKQAEELLQRNKSLLEMMSNSSPFGYLLVDNKNGCILYFNTRFCQIWEVEELEVPMGQGLLLNDELLKRCIDKLESPEQISQTVGDLRIPSNKEVVSDELRLKSGKIIHRYTMQLSGAEDKYFGRFYIFEDVTESKLRETELKNARREAEVANSAKSEFLSRMSHELRTPLNSILGFAQLLELSEPTKIQQKGISHILQSGRHLLDLINEVLDISRIESGRIQTAPEAVELKPLLDEMFDIIKPIALTRNISLLYNNPDGNPLFIWVDRQRIKQVLLNLLNNAVKYNKQNGAIEVSARLITAAAPESSVVHIDVADTGLGIPDDDIPKIFMPFERASAAHTNIEGTGLGLSVSKKMIEAMDGRIGVESVKGVGSTFWIEVPVAVIGKVLF